MREILFRGKTDEGAWVYGYYLPYCVDENVQGSYYQNPTELPLQESVYHTILEWSNEFKEVILRSIQVIPETVGQYTGFLCSPYYSNAANGHANYLFDGDIVVGNAHDIGAEWQVYWWDGTWVLCSLIDHDHYVKLENTEFFPLEDRLSRIGNIHDNPELLEKKK